MNPKVWTPTAGTGFNYRPTPEGGFEAFMDKNDPSWRSAATTEIEFWRALWAAAIEFCAEQRDAESRRENS